MQLKELLESLKYLISFTGDNPYKHPLIYAIVVSIFTGFLFSFDYILISLSFFISIIFVSWCFDVVCPSIKALRKKDYEKRKIEGYLYNISDTEKNLILEFFPYASVSRRFPSCFKDYALRQLIENEILIVIAEHNPYYDYDPNYIELELKLTKNAREIINKRKLLEKWKNKNKT